MREEQQVVSQIKRFLDSEGAAGPGDLGALAEEYARLCERANERLKRCEQYLRSGRRTEAIHLAEESPPILDVAAVLDFQGAEAWREFCVRSKRLTAPPAIAAEAVAWLNQAYVQEQPVADLVSEYRRLTLRGSPLGQRIPLLRRLMKQDAANASHWSEDLGRFESARVDEIKNEVRIAAGSDDLQALQSLRSELKSPDWLAKPDDRLAAEVEKQLRRVRVKAAEQEGKRIAQEAWDAFSAQDYARTGQALKQWQALQQGGFFKPSTTLRDQMDEVREWFEIEERKVTVEAGFRQAAYELSTGIDAGLGRAELERRLNAALKYYEELPPLTRGDAKGTDEAGAEWRKTWPRLHSRAQGAIAAARQSEERARRLLVAACVVGLLLVAGVTFLVVQAAIQSRRRNEWATQIEAARKNGEYAGAMKLLAELKKAHPELAAKHPFPSLEAAVEEDQAAYQAERALCAQKLRQLEEFRAQGFPIAEPYGGHVRALQLLAKTEEEKARLSEWDLAWKAHLAKAQEARDKEFTDHLDKALAALERLEKLDAEKQPAECKEASEEMARGLDAAGTVANVSPHLVARVPLLREKWRAHDERHRQASDKLKDQKQLLEQIAGPQADLGQYEARVRGFLAKFPEHPDKARLERIVADSAYGKDLERGSQIPAAFDKETEEKAKQLLESPEAGRSLWGDALKWLTGQAAAVRRATDIVQAMQELTGKPRFYSLRRLAHKAGEEVTYYYQDDPKKLSTMGVGGREVVKYKIAVFESGDQPVEKEFALDAPIPADPLANLAPHSRWLRDVYAKLRNVSPQDCEGLLFRSVEELRTHPEIHPIVKVIFMKFLLTEAKKLAGSGAEPVDGLLKRLATVDDNVAWINAKPDADTLLARQESVTLLAGMTDIPMVALAKRIQDRVCSESLSRKARFVGQMRLDGEGRVKDTGGFHGSELWVVIGHTNAAPTIHVAAVADGKGGLEIEPSVKDLLYVGQPLFAPTDGRRTSDIVANIFKDVPAADQARCQRQIVWPSCWPVNARTPAVARGGTRDGGPAVLRAMARSADRAARPH